MDAASDGPFELTPIAAAALSDLDAALVADFLPAGPALQLLAMGDRGIADELAARRLATEDGTPTVLGLLLCCRAPERFLRGAWILVSTVGPAPGRDTRHELRGPVQDQLRQLDQHLATIAAAGRERPAYPLLALRELTWNAVLHRRYSGPGDPVRVAAGTDRIEIHSPGPAAPDLGTRNPQLAEALVAMGYARGTGDGLVRAAAAARRNGNPPPRVAATADGVCVTLLAAEARAL